MGFDAGDSNLYRYANNQPTVATDPSGLAPLEGNLIFKGNSVGTAAAGSYTDAKGKEIKSSEDDVKTQQKHIAEYDGKVEFKVKYKIVLTADNKVDQTKSTVEFDCVFWTWKGKKNTTYTMVTPPIPITSAKLDGCGGVDSFKFEGINWYVKPTVGWKDIINKSIKGELDITKGEGKFEGIYQYKENATLNTYVITSTSLAAP